jgi:hypothetical protein
MGRVAVGEIRVAVLSGDLRGERRGVRWPATGVHSGADNDSPALESNVDGGGAAVKMVTRLDVGGPVHKERTK